MLKIVYASSLFSFSGNLDMGEMNNLNQRGDDRENNKDENSSSSE